MDLQPAAKQAGVPVHWLLLGLCGPHRIVSAVPRQYTCIMELTKWILTFRTTVAGEPMVSKIVAANLNISSASAIFVKVDGILFWLKRCEYKSNTPTI